MIELSEPTRLDSEQRSVLEVVERLLDAAADRNANQMREILLADGVVTRSRDGEIRVIRLSELPGEFMPAHMRLEERLFDPLVKVDDEIAVVWAPYSVLVDGLVDHRGTGVLVFLRVGGRWRLSGMAETVAADTAGQTSLA